MGSAEAELLFIGEGPGREEDLAGEPFVGRSGKLLDRLMAEEIGLTRAECYIANVVKCRPPNNRDPAPKEIAACRPYLAEQIDLIDPSVIVTLGNFSTKLLLESTQGIRALRGQVFERGRARSCRPTTPPTCCAPAGEAMAEMRADLVRAKRLMAETGVSWPLQRRRARSRTRGPWPVGWPGSAGPATWCSWWVTSEWARRPSPRALRLRSG